MKLLIWLIWLNWRFRYFVERRDVLCGLPGTFAAGVAGRGPKVLTYRRDRADKSKLLSIM
jgi:hypothetical protein